MCPQRSEEGIDSLRVTGAWEPLNEYKKPHLGLLGLAL